MRNNRGVQRGLSGLLAILLFAGCFMPFGSASAAVVLPGMLTELGDEAFLGDYQVDGHIALPSGMQTLGQDVFQGTRLYAMTVPVGVATIPAQGLSGAAYVRLLGAATSAESGAFSGVAYVFGPSDSAARQQAEADGAIFICEDALVSQDGFWYHVDDGEATLLCAVDNVPVSGSVRIPTALADGTPVAALASTATLRLSALTHLELPYGIGEESGCFSGCPDAIISYYSDAFCVTSLRANRSSVSVGAEVTWIANTNSTGVVEYYFEVSQVVQSTLMLISRSDGFRSSLLYEDSNLYTVALDTPGVYVAKVICRDEAGTEVSAESAEVTVRNTGLTIATLTSDVLADVEGCDVTWTATTDGGNGEALYHWQLLRDGEIIADVADSASASYTLSGAEAGEYVMRLSARDDLSETTLCRAEKVRIYTQEQAAPQAPVWTDSPFADAQADAPVLEAGNLTISWASVDCAAQYGVILALEQDGVWTEIVHQQISGSRTTATIPASALTAVTADTPCRVSLYTTNLEAGAQRHYYATLQPHVIDESLTLDGSYTTRNWFEAYYGAGTRTFTVQSELPWTVTCANGADWVSWQQDDGTLVVTMAENETAERQDEKLTLSNGVNSATIYLRHHTEHVPPQIITPACGTSESSPAELPMRPFELNFARNGGYMMYLFICQQNEDGTFTTLERVSDVGDSYVVDPVAIGLVPGRTVRFSLYGYYNTYASTVNKTSLMARGYVLLHGSESSVALPSGESAASLLMSGTSAVLPIAFTGSMPTVTSDADWLSGMVDAAAQALNITGSANASSDVRTGTLTLVNGSDTLTVTVTQEAHLPEVLAPLALSETEADRTRLYIQSNSGSITLLVRGAKAVLTNTVTSTEVLTAKNSTSALLEVTIALDDVVTSNTHTLTVTNYGLEKVFYCYFSKNTSKVYFTNGTDYEVITIASAGGSVDTTFTASSSWTAATTADWLTLSVASGKSVTDQPLTVTAAANSTCAPREADVIITRGNVRATLHITQEAAASTALLTSSAGDPARLTMPGYRDDRSVRLGASAGWTLSTDVDWLFFNSARTQTSLTGYGSDMVDVYCSAYDGTEPRYGNLLLTCGSQTAALPVVQLPYSAAISVQPALSEEEVNTLSHGDLTFSWTVDDAWIDSYTLEISVPVDETGDMQTYEYIFPANGTGSYTFTLPASFCVPDTGETCYVDILARNAAMSRGTLFSAEFLLVSDAAVLVDAKPRAAHSGVSDYGDAFTHIVTSDGTWTASSSAAWLNVSSTSGASGESLTVTADRNFGETRTGVITLQCGGDTATITVQQLAGLTPYPTLNGDGLSTSIRNPAIIPASTTTLSYAYDVEPAASRYVFELWEIEKMRLIGTLDEVENTYTANDANRNLHLRTSSVFTDSDEAGTLTLSDLTLQPGRLYCLNMERQTNDDRKNVSTAYWFYTSSGAEAELFIDSRQTDMVLPMAAEGEFAGCTIHNDGTWYATTSADWIMLYSKKQDEEDLMENGRIPSDYNSFVSTGETLYISVLANESDLSRTGEVTLHRFGGSETATITVTQNRYCVAAALVSPALNSDSADPIVLPYGGVTFMWTESEDSAGKYTLTIREKDGRSYYNVWKRTTTSLSLTPPASIFTPGTQYRVYLDTYVDDTFTVSRTYEFRAGYENELTVVADVEWRDDVVIASAQASGGSGSGYKYSFNLYYNGEVVTGTTRHDAQSSMSFPLDKAGLWQLEVYVTDSEGQGKRVIVSEKTLDEAVLPDYVGLSRASWLAPVEGGETSLTVYANGEWQCLSSADWLHASAAGGSAGPITVTAFANTTGAGRSATLTFTSGTERAVFSVTQQAEEVSEDASISLNQTQWTLPDTGAATMTLAVTATDGWLISSCPDWITPSAVSGTGDGVLTLYCSPNSGDGRNGTVTFLCGAASAQMAVAQPSGNLTPSVASFTMDMTTVATGEPVTFSVAAENATAVVLMVDGVKHESYPVTDGASAFTRAFSSEGERSVQIVPMNGAIPGMTTEPQTLTVVSYGSLAAPVLQAVEPVVLGAEAAVSWNAVPHAEAYTVRLYYGTIAVATRNVNADTTSVTFTADELAYEGSYTLVVLATAAGYSQSEAGMFVDVFCPQVNFSITSPKASYGYVPADTIDIQVDNPSGYHIAVKVTDEHGNVTYLPEGNGTVSDVSIQGVLQYAPLDTGEITIQAMAYPSAVRTRDEDAWYDASRNVTCTVNGPIVSRIHINGKMGAVRMTDDMETMTITTNNGVDVIRVELDGVPLAVTKDGVATTDPIPYDSEVDFVRTFTCTLPAATEGFHAYAVIGTDKDGRTHRLTYRFYVVKPCEKFTVYAQTQEKVVYDLPSDAQEDAERVSMLQPLTVVGSCGNMHYVLYERTRALFFSEMAYGFISKNAAAATQKLDAENARIYSLVPAGKQYSYVGNKDRMTLRWMLVGAERPEEAVYHVYHRAVGETVWSLIGVATEQKLSIDLLDYAAGEYEFAVTIKYNDVNSLHNEFARTLQVFQTALECAEAKYADTESGGLTQLKKRVCLEANEAVYWGETHLDSGVRDEVYISAAKIYDVLGENSVLDSGVGAQYQMLTGIMEQLAVKKDNQSVGWIDSMYEFVDTFDKATVAVSFIEERLEKAKKSNEKFSDFTRWMVSNNPKELFEDSEMAYKDILYLGNAMTNYVRYDAIPDEDLLMLADCLRRSSDPELRGVANMLEKMTAPDGLAAFVISGCGLEVAKMIEGTATDWFYSLLSKQPVCKLLVDGAFVITEDLMSVSETSQAAYLCNANLDVLEAYMPVYRTAIANFERDPLTYYEDFVSSSSTYYLLLHLSHESLLDWLEVVNESVANKILSIFDNQYEEVGASIKRNRGKIIVLAGEIDAVLELLWDEVLYDFDIRHTEIVMPR